MSAHTLYDGPITNIMQLHFGEGLYENVQAIIITAVDLPAGRVLIGHHEVLVISDIMLISETQALCFGVDIDSKSHHFGGRASIIFYHKT